MFERAVKWSLICAWIHAWRRMDPSCIIGVTCASFSTAVGCGVSQACNTRAHTRSPSQTQTWVSACTRLHTCARMRTHTYARARTHTHTHKAELSAQCTHANTHAYSFIPTVFEWQPPMQSSHARCTHRSGTSHTSQTVSASHSSCKHNGIVPLALRRLHSARQHHDSAA